MLAAVAADLAVALAERGVPKLSRVLEMEPQQRVPVVSLELSEEQECADDTGAETGATGVRRRHRLAMVKP
jgi:hypothetical protein